MHDEGGDEGYILFILSFFSHVGELRRSPNVPDIIGARWRSGHSSSLVRAMSAEFEVGGKNIQSPLAISLTSAFSEISQKIC